MTSFFRIVLSVMVIIQFGAGSIQVVRASFLADNCTVAEFEPPATECGHEAAPAHSKPVQKPCCCGGVYPCCMSDKAGFPEISGVVSQSTVRAAVAGPVEFYFSPQDARRTGYDVNRDMTPVDPGPLYIHKKTLLI